jgi:hypothetical protein
VADSAGYYQITDPVNGLAGVGGESGAGDKASCYLVVPKIPVPLSAGIM